MPRRPASADAIGIGGIVIAVTTAGAAVAFTPNVVIGLVLMAIAASVAVVLVVWYVIGSRNQRIDRKKAVLARIEAERPFMEALASLGTRPAHTAINAPGAKDVTVKDTVFGPGFDQDINVAGGENIDLTGNVHSGTDSLPNRAARRSRRRSKHG